MKKLFTLLAAALMAVGVNAATTGTISPDDTWTVAGGSPLITPAWDPAATENDMTANGDGSFSLTVKNVTLDTGTGYEWKVVQNHDWANLNYGDPTNLNDAGEPNNLKLYVEKAGVYDVTFTVTPGENALEVTPTATTKFVKDAEVSHTYVVAGEPAALFGPTWNTTEATNQMKLDENEDSENFGLYVLTKTGVTLDKGEILWKIVQDGGTWFPAANQSLKIDEAGVYTVTFTLDAASKAVDATATKTGEAGPITHTYVVAGGVAETGDASFFGVSWKGTKEEAPANVMKANEDGTYSLTFDNVANAAPTTYEFKVVEDGGTWYGNGDGNYTVELPEVGKYDVTFNFDPATKVATATATLDATGINSVETVKVNVNAPIFNLAGQRVSKAYKGVVIQGGKKFIQK